MKVAIIYSPFLREYFAHFPDDPWLGVGRGHCAKKALEELLVKVGQRRRGEVWMTI